MNDIPAQSVSPDAFCSELSREVGESLIGTAVPVGAWLLLEYSGPWTAKATTDNDLPHPVQGWLDEQLDSIPNSRVQFIKQSPPVDVSGINFFVGLTREAAPLLYHFRLDDYQDLLALDPAALLSGENGHDEFIYSEPLFLVCTNGRRDRCCARFGVTLFPTLAAHLGDAVWQSTHLGGHRFAPNLVTFPDGTYYGRLTQSDVDAFVTTHRQGEIDLNHLRGRCCYDKVTQAADYYLRRETGVRERAAYRLLDKRRLDETQWAVRFAEPAAGQTHQIVLTQEMSESEHLVSCSPMKTKAVLQFRFVHHESE
jgi:hypothetical protein